MKNTNNWPTICITLLIGLILVAACTGGQQSAVINAELDTPFQLKIGQSVQVDAEGLTIEFLEVTEDSRCPEDVQCIVAGQVSTLVSVSENGATRGDYTLTSGLEEEKTMATTPGGHTIQLLAVEPYPATTQGIERADYVATFQILEN